MLILLGLGAFTLLLSLPTWVEATAATPLGPQPVTVSGAGALPMVPSAALVVMAAGLAMGLSGRVVRYLAPAAAAGAAVIAVIVVVGLIGDPSPAARAAAGEVGGVRELAGPARLTLWPWLAALALGLSAAIAVVLPFRAGVWAPAARKYERGSRAPAPDSPVSPRADWDALSHGEDPSVLGDTDATGEAPQSGPQRR